MKFPHHHLWIEIVLSLAVLISSGCGLVNRIAPTVTPTITSTSTATPVPTATFTSTPTPLPTDPPTPAPSDTPKTALTLTPTSAVFQQIQTGGSTKVQDRKNGYQITIPANWTILDLSTGDLDKILSASAEVNPEASQMIETYKPLLTQGAGIMAIDTDISHSKNMIYPILLSIGLMDNLSAAMPLNFIIEANVQSVKQVAPNAQVLSSGVSKNKNNLEVGIIELLMPTSTSYGDVNVYERLVIFKVKSGLVLMVIVTDQDLVTTMDPILKNMIDSINIL